MFRVYKQVHSEVPALLRRLPCCGREHRSLIGLLITACCWLPGGLGESECEEGRGAESQVRSKRAGTSPVNAVVRGTIMERQVHFESSD